MTDPLTAALSPYACFGIRLGLEPIQALLSALGSPQLQVPLIHVAGTNGKGSVCAYLDSVLRAAGYRTGRYTSPHLLSWCERICVDGNSIAPEVFLRLIQQIEAVLPQVAYPPSQFEVITAAAWLYFAQQQVEVAVIEVGLGGRLDATNVCQPPLVSVITSIGWDHWQRLGNSLGAIAAEKAGILKQGVPAVIGPVPAEAQAVIAKRLDALACPAIWPEPAQWCADRLGWATWRGIEYPLPLAGEMQLVNSAIAIAALQCLQTQGWQISLEAIQQGIAQTRWPGRLQWLPWQGRKLLIDGAHNAPAAAYLRQYVDQLGWQEVTWVVGMLANKDHEGILKHLLRAGDRLLLVPVPAHASADLEDLQGLARTCCPQLAECRLFKDVTEALNRTGDRGVVCGSLYLIAHVLGAIASKDSQVTRL
ncbi:MAG: folylpolyglutamate synthase/dihydrofolate synthase family protein [Thermosynechococcus sp. Uc]|uniref:bifunctional folylpolyglutamate synthase/dihydrofolate synthase n=1 Tax=Thermosynechococcus sp. Uc TaxID=3034853 RepID=UPI001A101634|nr:folylpolyglutamate synthase/dihydrofolate synthase family protein [Thermosynechococcus sp. Uc]MDM7326755.1 folylpolyglutamate synthase/dihydrofolate synthase family protein [Thermosynechococcus sp. Uc]HIK26188.1 bifunctional folylpolyglutamate synthase/dihydrofolate synthase [Thermosynechococcus sp. M46_R2017_013]